MKLIQRFTGPLKPQHKDLRPFCENPHPNRVRASGFYQDQDGKTHNLCDACAGSLKEQEPLYQDW